MYFVEAIGAILYTGIPTDCQWKVLPSHLFYFLYSAVRQAQVVGLDQGHASVWQESRNDSRPLCFCFFFDPFIFLKLKDSRPLCFAAASTGRRHRPGPCVGVGGVRKRLPTPLFRYFLYSAVTCRTYKARTSRRLRPGLCFGVERVKKRLPTPLIHRELPDEVFPLHRSDSSASLRTPGISPLVRSWYRSRRWDCKSSSDCP